MYVNKSPAVMSAELIRELFDYNPLTGVFVRKAALNCGRKSAIGKVAGFIDYTGYGYIKVARVRYSQHRLAWLYMHGEWPKNDIDHIDGNPSNNAISNLRDVTRQVNSQNHKKAYSTSDSQLLGVLKHFNKWRAQIRVSGKGVHIGLFDTAIQAHEAYLVAKRQLHEGNTL